MGTFYSYLNKKNYLSTPKFAYEFLQIFNWARKAQTCGLQLIPIPADPLALPYSLQSDPLRGPVFIPLDIECLMEDKEHLFEGNFALLRNYIDRIKSIIEIE